MKLLKVIWPFLIILLVWFVFASPFFIHGKVPFPSDYLVNNFAPWSAYTGFASPIKNAATPDVINQIYPWKNLAINIWKEGQIPLWNPYSFSGTPLLANYQSAALSPINILYFILPFVSAWSLQVLLAPLFAGVFTYLFLRSLSVSKSGSVISSLAFMFSGFIVTWMVYGTLPYAILFLPLALFSIEKFYTNQKWYWLILLAISIPLSFFSGHFQTSLYFLLVVLAYIIFKSFTQKNIKSGFLSFTSVVLGLLLSSPQLLPSIEFYSESVRAANFIKTEVIPWEYLPTFIAPDFFGNPSTRNDWFGHYAEWNAYIGLVPLMLGFYAFRKINTKILFFAVTCFVVILLAFQTPFLDLLILLKIPVLSTSAASRIIVIFSFAAAVLTGFGFDTLILDITKGAYKWILILLGIFALIFLALWAIVLTHSFLPIDKVAIALSNLKLPTTILIILTVTLLIVSFARGRRAAEIISIVLIFLCAFEMLRFTSKWMPFEPKSLMYPDVAVSDFLKTIESPNRVFGNLDGAFAMTYKAPSVEGYDPLYIQRYGELVGASQDGLYHTPGRSAVVFSKTGQYTPKLINLLGIKYFVQKKADGQEPWAFPVWTYPIDQFRVIYQDEAYQVLENEKALPRAFIAENNTVLSDKREILKKMFIDDTDLSKTAVLENPSIATGSGTAKIINYKPNKINIETNSNSSALLVLTDPYYPGWKALVNGSPAKIMRADYALRAVEIPAGENKVEFKYEPNSFKNGVVLFFVGIVGLFGLTIYFLAKVAKKA